MPESEGIKLRRVVAVALTVAITFHWIRSYWFFDLRPLWDLLPPAWRYEFSGVVLGLLLTGWSPAACGLRLGDSLRCWRFVMILSVIMLVPMITGMLFIRNPFFGGSPSVYVCVPLTEELLFRGFCFAILADAFEGAHMVRSVRVSNATVLSAVAFGLWHLGGLRLPAENFIYLQLFYTMLGGLLFGILRDQTRSIWPGWLVHVIVNICAVHMPGFWAHVGR